VQIEKINYFHQTLPFKEPKTYYMPKDGSDIKKLENTEIYTHLIEFKGDEWHVSTAESLEEEKKLIEAGFEYVRYSDKDEVAIYRKRK
jgi:hypothetical protein